MLSVADLQRSLVFYRDLLGFTETYRFPPGDAPAFVTVGSGTSELGLGQLGPGPALHGQVQRPATGHRIELCVYVDDLEAAIARARRADVRVVLEPCSQKFQSYCQSCRRHYARALAREEERAAQPISWGRDAPKTA